MTTRRRFLAASAASAILSTPTARLFAQTTGKATLALTGTEGLLMPADYIGLSYEVQQLTDPSFFSPANKGLIAQFRAMSKTGVLRLGGNTSEFAWWKPTPATPEPEHPKTREVAGEPPAKYYSVTAEAVTNLAGFLKATGWTCLYGINLGTNTPERAADEAVFATKALGDSLQYFQIGNEVDMFDRHLRDPKTWNFETYFKEWLNFARAITARVPDAKFGMPDVANDVGWLTSAAEALPGITNAPHITTLSHHSYFGGPATNPKINIPAILKDTHKMEHEGAIATAAAKRIPDMRIRMTEGNTCYRGGKPGVSDVFAAALWSANYALYLASIGYSGLNLHGGTGMSVANSVGGFLPGDKMLEAEGKSAAEIATHPHPFYTPIATFGDSYKIQPVGMGLMFAGSFAGGTLLPVTFNPGDVNATAYAAKLPNSKTSFILLNKDETKDLEVAITLPQQTGRIAIEKLIAPSLDARSANIMGPRILIPFKNGTYTATVRKASGLRITVS